MEWRYIAGFFDGEGSITHNGKGYRITIAQTQRLVLESIKQFTDVGWVISVKKRKSHWKDSWVYYIARQEDVYKFLLRVNQYLIVKKVLAQKVFGILQHYLKRRKQYLAVQKQRLRKADELRKQGLSYREIGKKVGGDWSYIRRALIRRTGF